MPLKDRGIETAYAAYILLRSNFLFPKLYVPGTRSSMMAGLPPCCGKPLRNGDEMEELNVKKTHKIQIVNRQTTNLGGVTDVISFDEREVVLETERGMLTIRGEGLHVSRLTLEKGEVDVEGRVDAFQYSDTAASRGKEGSLISRMFR